MALACMITISGFNTEHILNIFYQSVLVINVFDNCSLNIRNKSKGGEGGGGLNPTNISAFAPIFNAYIMSI